LGSAPFGFFVQAGVRPGVFSHRMKLCEAFASFFSRSRGIEIPFFLFLSFFISADKRKRQGSFGLFFGQVWRSVPSAGPPRCERKESRQYHPPFLKISHSTAFPFFLFFIAQERRSRGGKRLIHASWYFFFFLLTARSILSLFFFSCFSFSHSKE